MKLGIILLAFFAISGCAKHGPTKAALAIAFPGSSLVSAREMKYSSSGLREQVYELFFRIEPSELKDAIKHAGFIREDTIPERIIGSNSSFKNLVGAVDLSDVIGFRRADLKMKDGKYCHLLCSKDFTWAYFVYVDFGES